MVSHCGSQRRACVLTDTIWQVQSLKVPAFLKFIPEVYDPKTYEPTEWDVENARSEKPKLAVRYYNDPETGELKSNAVIYRWSDGSSTMSVGDQHFALNKKDTVPPAGKPYNEIQDAHSYAAAAHLSSGLFAVVGHVGAEYTVRLNKSQADDAMQRLAMRMREARSETEASRIIKTTHDPELQRKQAELAEKERMKAQRRRDNAAAKAEGAAGGRYGRGGISIDDLEGSRRGPGGRKRGAPGGKGRRRKPEYDSDDDRPDGAHRQEDYDLEDDFIAPSDDEGDEDAEDDEEEEELLDDDDDEDDDEPKSKRQKRAKAKAADDEDGDGEPDDDVRTTSADHAGRSRRRNVIDDDDED